LPGFIYLKEHTVFYFPRRAWVDLVSLLSENGLCPTFRGELEQAFRMSIESSPVCLTSFLPKKILCPIFPGALGQLYRMSVPLGKSINAALLATGLDEKKPSASASSQSSIFFNICNHLNPTSSSTSITNLLAVGAERDAVPHSRGVAERGCAVLLAQLLFS
jgi:hypothetical protein